MGRLSSPSIGERGVMQNQIIRTEYHSQRCFLPLTSILHEGFSCSCEQFTACISEKQHLLPNRLAKLQSEKDFLKTDWVGVEMDRTQNVTEGQQLTDRINVGV